MNIQTVAEVIERYFYSGRVQSSGKKLERRDFVQLAKAAWANIMRESFYAERKLNYLNGTNEHEELFTFSPIISTQTIPLSDGRNHVFKVADMSKYELYRLPKNVHIQNIYAVSCNNSEDIESIPQVQPAEENFYVGADFLHFKFAVLKGRALHIYHLPECVKSVDVEATFDSNDIEVPLDFAFDIINAVLGISLKVKGFPIKSDLNPYDPEAREIKRMLEQDKPLNA